MAVGAMTRSEHFIPELKWIFDSFCQKFRAKNLWDKIYCIFYMGHICFFASFVPSLKFFFKNTFLKET